MRERWRRQRRQKPWSHQEVAKFFAPKIKTPTMLDTAGPSPNGVLLAGFKSRVQCWICGADQPVFLKVVLRYR